MRAPSDSDSDKWPELTIRRHSLKMANSIVHAILFQANKSICALVAAAAERLVAISQKCDSLVIGARSFASRACQAHRSTVAGAPI